jgi:hypothetical protein
MTLDARDGFVEITRHGFALLGLIVIGAALMLTARPELRATATTHLLGWLEARQITNTWSPAESFAALERTTAGDPLDLPAEQASVTYWLSRKYNVSPEPLSVLVAEAFQLGERTQIAPTLILAIMAIESNFNPFAQSSMGGQGLMQLMPMQQSHKLDQLGGPMATFDPLSNMRVGVSVLLRRPRAVRAITLSVSCKKNKDWPASPNPCGKPAPRAKRQHPKCGLFAGKRLSNRVQFPSKRVFSRPGLGYT